MPLDALGVQTAFIAALQADSDIVGLFRPRLTDGTDDVNAPDNPLLDDDPLRVSPLENAICAVVIAGENEEDATLGGSQGGTFKLSVVFGIVIYLYDDSRGRGTQGLGASRKRELVRVTTMMRRICDQHRNDTSGQQMWYLTKWRKPTTTYHFTENFRESITFIEVYSRDRYSR